MPPLQEARAVRCGCSAGHEVQSGGAQSAAAQCGEHSQAAPERYAPHILLGGQANGGDLDGSKPQRREAGRGRDREVQGTWRASKIQRDPEALGEGGGGGADRGCLAGRKQHAMQRTE